MGQNNPQKRLLRQINSHKFKNSHKINSLNGIKITCVRDEIIKIYGSGQNQKNKFPVQA